MAWKSGEWFRRVRFVILAPDSHAQPCALSGRDSTHRTVRNCGAVSPAFIAEALGTVARAHGMTDIAKATGLGRESLYKALSAAGNPELATVLKVVAALGLRLSVERAGKV